MTPIGVRHVVMVAVVTLVALGVVCAFGVAVDAHRHKPTAPVPVEWVDSRSDDLPVNFTCHMRLKG